MPTATALPINTSATALDMANEIFGAGVTVNSATYAGAAGSSGIFSNGDTISPDATPGDSGVILSTGNATDFTNNSGTTNTNVSPGTSTDTAGIDGNADFNALAGTSTFDASILTVNFTPTGDQMTVDFVISSEEYPEYVNSQFLDVVGVWVNGTQAQVSIGNGTASVGNINGATTPNLYNDNTADQFNTEMDGFTVTLTFVAPVNPGVANTIQIGVADTSDASYDTNLLIAGGSVQTAIVLQDDAQTFGHNDTKTIDVLANDSAAIGGTLTITHLNGIAVTVGTPITLGSGQQITLNADGTITVVGDADAETVYFSYTAEDSMGNSDTALVEIEQIPCFVTGTLIETPQGARAVETLQAGDLVETLDDGAQPILWAGARNLNHAMRNRPVMIPAGTLGAQRDTWVSPHHCVLVAGHLAELFFGTDEVFVRARDLAMLGLAHEADAAKDARYHHLLLPAHSILFNDGLQSESLLPGPRTKKLFGARDCFAMEAALNRFGRSLRSYGGAARQILRRRETHALAA